MLLPHVQVVLQHGWDPEVHNETRSDLLHNTAWFALSSGRYDSACSQAESAYHMRRSLFGDKHKAASLGLLATVLGHQGKYAQAEEMHQRVLRLKEMVLGKEHPDTLTSMNNLAVVLRDQGKYEQTEEMHSRPP